MAAPIIAAGAAKGLAENKWTPIILGAVIVGVAAIGYFGVYRPIMCRTGVIECKREKRIQKLKDRLTKLDALNPRAYDPSKVTFATHEVAKVEADKLDSALGVFDDEEEVYAVLNNARNRHNMALIAKYYQIRHGESLADDLAYQMSSEAELNRMIQILQSY